MPIENVKAGTTAIVVGVFANVALAGVKITSGIVGNSYALVADGIESCTDIFTSLAVLGGLRVAVLPADDNHPYGHGKAETLAAALAALALLGAATLILFESVKEILTPHTTPASFTLIVLGLVVIVKWLLSRFVTDAANSLDSTALKGDAWHHLSDALTSLAAFIGISIALIGGKGYESADDWAALFACVIIYYNGSKLLKTAVDELMDVAPSPEFEQKIRNVSKAVEGVIDIEKCRIRKSGLYNLIDVHVVVDGNLSVRIGHDIAHRVKDKLMSSEHKVADVLVHVEPNDCPIISQTAQTRINSESAKN